MNQDEVFARTAQKMGKEGLREKLMKLIRENDWNYDEHMAEANVPTPEEQLADSILAEFERYVEKHRQLTLRERYMDQKGNLYPSKLQCEYNQALDDLITGMKGGE